MKRLNLSARQRVGWILINYGLFLLAFFTLGFLSGVKAAVVLNFLLDAVLCAVCLVLNLGLFAPRYRIPLLVKLGLLSVTLLLTAFTIFAFLLPENGLPPVLFS